MAVEADSLTMHGIGRVIATTSGGVRAFWSTLLLASVTFASIFVFQLVSDYMKYETDLTFTAEVHQNMKFPVVTLCNGLRIYNVQNKSTFTDGFQWYSAANQHFCQFDKQPCPFSNLTYRERIHEKSCLEFNFDETVHQKMPMLNSGLVIDFFINESDITVANNNFYNPREEAVKVYIHSSKEFPFFFNNQLVAMPGHTTKIVIKKVRTIRQRRPYKSNCTEDEDGSLDYFPGNYTVTGCLLTHLQIILYKHCGILIEDIRRFFPFKKYGTARPDNECLQKLMKTTKIFGSEATPECPLPCFEEKYEIKSSTVSKYPLEPQLSMYKKLFLQEKRFIASDYYIRSNIGRVVIGFDDFQEVSYEEMPKYTMQKVLSDFGGLIGVYLGASFISVAELLAVGMYLLVACIRKVKGKGQEDTKPGAIHKVAVEVKGKPENSVSPMTVVDID